MPDFAWPAGSATGVGSMPGTDVAEAQRTIFGELPDLPHLAELPERGPGADMIGRSAGFLVDLPVQVYAGRWQVAPRPGTDLRRTADLLERDLDQLTEQGDGFAGLVKLQSAGPWTLAASIDLPIGGRLLRDQGAVRDLTDSLAEGLRRHVDEVRKRLPRASLLLQLDEPSLPAVLAGHVPTESGLGVYRAVEAADAATALRTVVSAVGVPVVVHSCAPSVPLQVIRDSQAAAVSLDMSLIEDLDPLGETIEAGLGIFAGVVPTRPVPGRTPDAKAIAEKMTTLWRQRLGFSAEQLARQVVLTPACGLAGAPPAYVRAVLTALREAGLRLSEAR
ncbi:methionine synthase [Actinoplanes sp. TBRC 11911]|uniref:methionine synthase n=1 Tax=Actinoplanes sp. TBRC 11911 TaxID=2729386 RepID=UPI0028A0F537|nr:methionine synthase [Actinoplanes sp. TBRC 11911]